MPYLDSYTKSDLESRGYPVTPGELNYILTQVAIKYLDAVGDSYATHAEIISAFECAKLEWYRRKVAPYEDAKMAQNGDVY